MNGDKLTRDYRCARCWGALVEKNIDGKWVIVCASDSVHQGYVTAGFVNHRRALDNLEASEVFSQYADLLKMKRPDMKAARQALYGSDEGII